MKKVFKIENLDCANCAAKMEEAIKKIEGVNRASVSFMTQKLTLDADDEMMDTVLEQANKAVKKVDRNCVITE